MSKQFILHTLGAVAIASALLTGCKADDGPSQNSELWSGSLADAPYEAEAICLDLKNAPYKTIELTANGTYIITPADHISYAAPAKPLRRVKKADQLLMNLITGIFTYSADGSFNLDKFGILKWDASTGKVTLELEEGGSYVWDATEAPKVSMTTLNRRLCRSWKIYEVEIECYDSDDRLLQTFKPSAEEIREEYVSYFTYTSSSRLYTYDEDEFDCFAWKWMNTANQIMYICSLNEDDGDGLFQVLFKDNDIRILGSWSYNPYNNDYEGTSVTPPSSTSYIREYLTCREYRL